MRNPVIIGAGTNGLSAAFYLAQAGLTPIVLESRGDVGGGAITAALHPGFRCPTLSHEVLVHERIVREMNLSAHGVEWLPAGVDVCSLADDGPPLVLDADVKRTAQSLATMSPRDAAAYPAFRASLATLARVMGRLVAAPAPSFDRVSAGDLWHLLTLGRAVKGLPRRDAYRLLRWVPMPAADFVSEWFEHERLRATLAAPGLLGTMLGPRSAGSTLQILLRETHIALAGGIRRARGGPGAVTQAMAAAARAVGAAIRTNAAVERIVVRKGKVVAVVAAGQEIETDTVMSAVDPRTTFLRLLDPADLEPGFTNKMRNYRARGTTAKVNLALSALPQFGGVQDSAMLTGRIHVGPTLDYLERAFDHAKYGEISAAPWLELTLPSIADADLAPHGAHVASIYVHYVPRTLRGMDWSTGRDLVLEQTMAVLERHAPGISALVIDAQVVTPDDLETEYGFGGGHIFHGELALDQSFTMRPIIGYERYDSPVSGLHLCGAGTHPGGFMTALNGRLAAREVLKRRR